MFKFDLLAIVKTADFKGPIVARCEYADGRIAYCVQEQMQYEGHVPRQVWVPQSAILVDVPEPPAP